MSYSTYPGDRRIHAENDNFHVVRYERAGKWYLETIGHERLRLLTLDEAVGEALRLERLGGKVILKVPGGLAFDRAVRRRRQDTARSARLGG